MHLESNEKEQYHVNELVQIMTSNLQEASIDSADECYVPYKNQYMKQKLLEKYGVSIFICKDNGNSDIVTMKESTTNILRKYNSQPAPLTEQEEKCRIITTAAKLIKSDIKSLTKNVGEYTLFFIRNLFRAIGHGPLYIWT